MEGVDIKMDTDFITNDVMMDCNDDNLLLLKQAQQVIHAEKALTDVLERAAPYLAATRVGATDSVNPSISSYLAFSPHVFPRVRPLPKTMQQVHEVLSLARSYAARTSAPPGWNPQAPVLGFSVPNPLPHQLRGGALAQKQLERAQQKIVRENKAAAEAVKQQLEKEKQEKTAEEEAHNNKREADETENEGEDRRDPKRREIIQHEQQVQIQDQQQQQQQEQNRARSVMPPPAPRTRVDVSMNLSGSSSSSSSESGSDEDD